MTKIKTKAGKVVEVNDTTAGQMIRDGYAKPVKETAKKAETKTTDKPTKADKA